jgi:hypothetical protein
VFCRLQLALNLSQQFSHPVLSQSAPKLVIIPRRVTGCRFTTRSSTAMNRQSADQTAPLAYLEFIAGLLAGETN